MALELYDTHCHLNLAEHFPDPDAEIVRAREAGVTQLNLVGIDLESSKRAVDIARRYDGVHAVVGWHPNSAATWSEENLQAIEALARHPKVVAIGEIGLDYHWEYATPEQQQRCLEDQLELAERMAKPVVFHCRKAYDKLLATLERREVRPYLFHCFSGDAGHAEKVLKLEGVIGIDGPITYKNSVDLRALCRHWPKERIVLETDSPYLAPEPYRGKPNHPEYLGFVNAELAIAWGESEEETARQTTENAKTFFGLA
jgi:TatD DNase family protein